MQDLSRQVPVPGSFGHRWRKSLSSAGSPRFPNGTIGVVSAFLGLLAALSAIGAVPASATDTIPPTTTATVSPLPNAAGWNNSNVTVTLTAVDNPGGSGVKSITFDRGHGNPTTVNGASATVNVHG